jgi:hypothetical protein
MKEYKEFCDRAYVYCGHPRIYGIVYFGRECDLKNIILSFITNTNCSKVYIYTPSAIAASLLADIATVFHTVGEQEGVRL